MQLSTTFLKHFESLKDPRADTHNKRHNLHDILVITILGSICGADNWVDICEFGKCKLDWLKKFLELPNGIPSHDTFGRVFSCLDPQQFEECFRLWIQSLSVDVHTEIIAIDGKTLRGSGNRRKGDKALHMVSAWASQQGLLLGQVKTDEKSNEITAIPKLLKMIDITDSVVTIDAMGCQKDIAEEIILQNGDYILALKENQQKLHDSVAAVFEMGSHIQFKKILHRRKVEKDHGHGRTETRRYTLISARDEKVFQIRWPGLKGIGCVETTRTINNEVERSKRYFLTSLGYEEIDKFMTATRKHWDIEINLHWSLDVSFREDHNQVHVGHAAENLGMVRRIALTLLKQETTTKGGISCRRKKAGWDHKYLLKVLQAGSRLQQA